MKKIFNKIQFLLVVGMITCLLFLPVNFKNWLTVLSTVLIFAFAGLNFAYVLLKNKKNTITSSLIIFSMLLCIIANNYIISNPSVYFVLLILSQISLISALLFNTKFSKTDIFYILAITIPFLLLVNLSPVFGYSNPLNRVLISFVVIAYSALFGLSISQLIRKHSAFNISFSIATLFNLLFGLTLIIQKQTTLTHRATPIINIILYFILFIFSITTFFIDKDFSNITISIKKTVTYSVSIMLVTLLVGYTLVSNCLAYNLFTAKIYKDQFLTMVGNDLEIPIVEIYTQDNEYPTSKEEYVNCSFKISNCEKEEYNFSVDMAENYEDDNSVGIRLRGNTTRKARKQPYRIKFDKKKSFFNLTPNKSWVLLAEYFDQSYIRNYSAYSLAKDFDYLDFSPTPHHVALIINNEFKGLYVLCEQMDEKKGRANVDQDFDINADKEFPFFVELDFYAKNEGVAGVDNFLVDAVNNYVEIKYPEADERYATKTNDPVYNYIKEYVNAVFTTIKTNEKVEVSFRENPVGLEDLVDINSLVDYYLIHEIMVNPDSMYKSTYMHKTKDGLLKFGPIWDFDYSMTTAWKVPYDKSYIEGASQLRLANNEVYKCLLENEEFYNKVASRYQQKSSSIVKVYNMLKDYKNTIKEVALIDTKMWHGTTGQFQFDMQYDYVRLFLMDRYGYLNTVFEKSHSEFLSLLG